MTAPASAPTFLAARRSVRSFDGRPLDSDTLDRLVEAACLAPAPHHSRPWRFVIVEADEDKLRLADGMGARWRADLTRDGADGERIDELVSGSRARLVAAPALVLACLTSEGLDSYPDEGRRQAEFGMALLSLGAAVENLMLAATDSGLASCWVAAPIFCPHEARESLELPNGWLPQALVLVGHPDPAYRPRTRPPIDLRQLRLRR